MNRCRKSSRASSACSADRRIGLVHGLAHHAKGDGEVLARILQHGNVLIVFRIEDGGPAIHRLLDLLAIDTEAGGSPEVRDGVAIVFVEGEAELLRIKVN